MIEIDHLSVAAGPFALRDVSFTVPTGRYAVLMGRTGSGKTTLLEAICGLRHVTQGRIRLGGQDVTARPPATRGVGLVPQDGALFAHLSVREHLAFALHLRRWKPATIAERVAELADWLSLTPLLDRSIRGLSGGEAQRVALGRALAFHPPILCLDEPLSALDQDTRDSLCDLLASVQERTGVTVLHITHNRAEADRLAHLVFVLREGQLESAPAPSPTPSPAPSPTPSAHELTP